MKKYIFMHRNGTYCAATAVVASSDLDNLLTSSPPGRVRRRHEQPDYGRLREIFRRVWEIDVDYADGPISYILAEKPDDIPKPYIVVIANNATSPDTLSRGVDDLCTQLQLEEIETTREDFELLIQVFTGSKTSDGKWVN